MFIGTATTILEWKDIRLMTDQNFLRKGGRVQKGPGVSSNRLTDPAIDLYNLLRIDVVLVSNYHEYVRCFICILNGTLRLYITLNLGYC